MFLFKGDYWAHTKKINGVRYEVYSFYDGDKNVFDKITGGEIVQEITNNYNVSLNVGSIIDVNTLLDTYTIYKTNKTESLMIGKIKTTFLFITLISCYIALINSNFINFKNGFNTATINLQVLCLISYFVLFYKTFYKKEDTKKETEVIATEIEEDKTMKIDNLIELAEQYGTLDERDDY